MTDPKPEPRRFTTDDGSEYQGVPAEEFEDFSNVDHRDADPDKEA